MINFIKNKSVYLGRNAQGKETVLAQLICDTAAELAGVTEVKGVVLDMGSSAYAVNDAMFYVLDSEGEWHSVDDGEVISNG